MDERKFECRGCRKLYSQNEFRVNKNRHGEYCKSCQRILGHSAMKHQYTLQTKLEEIQKALEQHQQ